MIKLTNNFLLRSGARFTSPTEFRPHLQWLYSKNGPCECCLCPTPSSPPPEAPQQGGKAARWKFYRGTKPTTEFAGLPWHLRPGANAKSAGYSQWVAEVNENKCGRRSRSKDVVRTPPRAPKRAKSLSVSESPPELVSVIQLKTISQGSQIVYLLDDLMDSVDAEQFKPVVAQATTATATEIISLLSSEEDETPHPSKKRRTSMRTSPTPAPTIPATPPPAEPTPPTPTAPTLRRSPRRTPSLYSSPAPPEPTPTVRRSPRKTNRPFSYSPNTLASRPQYDGKSDFGQYVNNLVKHPAPLFPLPDSMWKALLPQYKRQKRS